MSGHPEKPHYPSYLYLFQSYHPKAVWGISYIWVEMYFLSSEFRWFLEKPFPGIEKWFENRGITGKNIPSRTDYYLIPGLENNLGIKLREGKIEIKIRIGEPVKRQILTSISGFEETYQKWSFPLDEPPPAFKELISDLKNWLPVSKHRLALVMDDSGNPDLSKRFHAPGTVLRAGCQFEYTRIEVPGKDYFTLGLECFGEPFAQPDLKILKDFFGDAKLFFQDSMGYVDFLKIQKHGKR